MPTRKWKTAAVYESREPENCLLTHNYHAVMAQKHVCMMAEPISHHAYRYVTLDAFLMRTSSFFYYVRAIHSAFFNTRPDCSDIRRRLQLEQRDSCCTDLLLGRENDRWIISTKSVHLQCILSG